MPDDVIQLCTKLYALADPQRGGSPEESHNAWVKLHELLAKHQIPISSVIDALDTSSRRRPHHPAYQNNSHWKPPPESPKPKHEPHIRVRRWTELPGFAASKVWHRSAETGRCQLHGAFVLWYFTHIDDREELFRQDPRFHGCLTQKQADALSNLGIIPKSVSSKGAAARLIGLLVKRVELKLASIDQLCRLSLALKWAPDDLDPRMTYREAADRLQAIG